jgi:hypothetical protein
MSARRRGHNFHGRFTHSTTGRTTHRLPSSHRNPGYLVDLLEPRRLLSLTAPISYTLGTTNDGFIPNAAPHSIVAADFNGDGKLDLAIAHTSENSVYILLGNGNGTFQAPQKISIGEAIQGDIFAGDFNNDGTLDLFLPSNATGNPAIVLLGNGDGTFKPKIDSSSFDVTGTYPRGWAVGDFNGDGKLDLVASLPSTSVGDSGGYVILLGNGDGTFQPGIAKTNVLGYSRWVAVGDFNGDGKLDLAFADGQQINGSAGNAELSIALGNGDGTFQTPTHYTSPGLPTSDTLNPEDVTVADVNGDGKLDCIISNYDDNINVFIGNGDGTFKPAVGYSPGQYPRDVIVADMNGDGIPDLVVTNLGINVGGAEFAAEGYQAGSVAVMLGNGDGTFQQPIQYNPFDFPGWTDVGDFNRDGTPDLATTQVYDGHIIAVMLNSPTSTNLPPTISSGPTATPTTVAAKTAALSVLGADGAGESSLTYTWATVVSPPGAVTFSANSSNAAKNTTVTFTHAGTYYFKVTITDAAGLSVIGMIPVVVSQTFASVGVAPANVSVAAGGSQQFTATAKDQFGNALSTQPTFTWTTTGGGSITSSGLFYAAPSAGGPFTISASSGGITGMASVTVTGTYNGPTIASPASASPSPVTGTTTALSALGADNTGESSLTYTWATTGTPPAPVTFSANGTNASKNTTATFTAPGAYTFQVTITDPSALTITSNVTVTVNQTLTTITISPPNPTVVAKQTVQFTATAFDQFGAQLATQPGFTWAAAGDGTINSAGLFTAGSTAGNSTVTATSGLVSNSASVIVATPGFSSWTGGGSTSNWSDPANWSNSAVPNSSATVVFNGTSSKNAIVDSAFAGTINAIQVISGYAGAITLGSNLTITTSFTQAAGTFNAGSFNLSLAGDFTRTGGAFNAGTGTLTINGTAANQNISAAGVTFNNFTLANSAHSLNVTGTLTVNGTFTWLRNAGYIMGPNGSGNAAIECRGDIDDQNHGGTGNPYFTLDGAGNQTIKDTSGVNNYDGYPGGDSRGLTINKSTGSVILACDPVVYNGLSLLKGIVSSGANFWTIGNEVVSTAPGLNLGNVALSNNVAAGEWASGLQLTNLNLNGHSLVAPSVLYISGNFSASGSGSSFNPNGGTVIFDGPGPTQQLTSAGNSFFNLTIASGATVQQQDELTLLGALTVNGTLDVANNIVLIHYGSSPSPIATIASLLASGYNNGAWNGPGIISTVAQTHPSYALGYADSADPGNPAALASATIEIRYTLLGDTNLDGVVNGVDFGILSANFNKGVTGWDAGDFNYDNAVNGVDFSDLSANFNQGANTTATTPSTPITSAPNQPVVAHTPNQSTRRKSN